MEKRIQSYRDLIVWQKSVKIVTEVYKLMTELPKEETFGPISQIKRSSISIPSNIARRIWKEIYEGFYQVSTNLKRFFI